MKPSPPDAAPASSPWSRESPGRDLLAMTDASPVFPSRLFSVKCAGCGDRLLPHELVMRAQSLVFHLHCFACVVCCQVLQKGDQYVLRGHQLFCRADYEKEMFLLQQHGPQSEWLS